MCISKWKKKKVEDGPTQINHHFEPTESQKVGESRLTDKEKEKLGGPQNITIPPHSTTRTPSVDTKGSRGKSAEDARSMKKDYEKSKSKRKTSEKSKTFKRVSPPKVMFAKRDTSGTKDAKDPTYGTLDGDYPTFQSARFNEAIKNLDCTQQFSMKE